MIKTYEKYIDEYKKDIIRGYFYGKDELLNKLYGFEDRGEFTIQVLDELLDLQQENQQLKKQKDDVVEYIKNGDILYLASKMATVYRDNIEIVAIYDRLKELLRMLGETE